LRPKSVLHFWHITSNCHSHIGRSMELSLYYPWVFYVWPAAGNGKVALVWGGLDVCETQCSGFQSFVIVHSLPQFRSFMTGCNKREWGLVAGQLASATLWLLCSSQSAQCSCLLVSEVDCCCAME
jgi:hypothetical protein